MLVMTIQPILCHLQAWLQQNMALFVHSPRVVPSVGRMAPLTPYHSLKTDLWIVLWDDATSGGSKPKH